MTKREIVWLIVKLIGVYFIYEAATAAWSLIGTIFTMMSLGSTRINPAESNIFLRAIAWSIAMIAFFGWIGWYLIKDGRLLFVVLNREEPSDPLEDLKKNTIIFSDEQK